MKLYLEPMDVPKAIARMGITVGFTGEVTAVDNGVATVKVVGANSLGNHVIATATLDVGSSRERSSQELEDR